MFSTIVITAGGSIFAEKSVFGSATRELDIFEFEGMDPVNNQEEVSDEKLIESWQLEMRKVRRSGNRTNISAEYSLLYSLEKNNKLQKHPKVTLIYTDTFTGNAAANLLKIIIEKDYQASVQLTKIPEFDVTNRIILNRALGNYMSIVSEELMRGTS